MPTVAANDFEAQLPDDPGVVRTRLRARLPALYDDDADDALMYIGHLLSVQPEPDHRDLLRDGENGTLVPAGDVLAPANALSELARDPALRQAQGARSRELARDWGYGPSVDGFLDAVREAVVH
jgi:hypothetical protein